MLLGVRGEPCWRWSGRGGSASRSRLSERRAGGDAGGVRWEGKAVVELVEAGRARVRWDAGGVGGCFCRGQSRGRRQRGVEEGRRQWAGAAQGLGRRGRA